MKNNNCAVCNNTIEAFNSKGPLYRCGDANVCSMDCSYKRFNELKIINPRLNEPLSWKHTENKITKTKSTLFCSDICINIEPCENNNPNVNKTIYERTRNIIIMIIINMWKCISK